MATRIKGGRVPNVTPPIQGEDPAQHSEMTHTMKWLAQARLYFIGFAFISAVSMTGPDEAFGRWRDGETEVSAPGIKPVSTRPRKDKAAPAYAKHTQSLSYRWVNPALDGEIHGAAPAGRPAHGADPTANRSRAEHKHPHPPARASAPRRGRGTEERGKKQQGSVAQLGERPDWLAR